MANKSEIRFAGAEGAAAPSRGRFTNTGNGPAFQIIDIEHEDYFCLVAPDTAFWSLVKRSKLNETLSDGKLISEYRRKASGFSEEMNMLRFGLKPSAVYFNPTEKCNLNCSYCYIPAEMRRNGKNMSERKLLEALKILKEYFDKTVSGDVKPQIVFHGAEPLLNKSAVFAGIDAYREDFRFGVQTNATMLDDRAVEFLTGRNVSIGLSLDAHSKSIADRTRKTWGGGGVYESVVSAMKRLRGYPGWSVICTITKENIRNLTKLVEFLHENETPTCLLNIVRCTLPPSRGVKPGDIPAAKHFISALERSYELYEETGRILPVANFANILLAIIAPTARRLMCDISPCGGGRCFFALATDGGLYPCSEFIGIPSFKGGNLFSSNIDKVLESKPFKLVTGRKAENIQPCNRCAIRHFCGSPCPAEAHEMNGGMDKPGAFCEFYEEQVRYAFRLIADGKHEAFLWEGWDKGTRTTFDIDVR
jgi:uncharacterized protein